MANKAVQKGLRIAVEGCVRSYTPPANIQLSLPASQGHGTLHSIYASVAKASEAKGWPGVDLLIIGGDFQVEFTRANKTTSGGADAHRQSAMPTT